MITSIETALVVDDDILMREFIVETLRRNGIHITQASNGSEAKKLLEERDFDLAFVDLKMPGLDGMQLLRFMKESGIATLTVMVTAFGTVEQAVEAMKIGAYDFLMKPFSPEQVELIIKRARELVNLQARNAYLEEELGWNLPRGKQLIGQSGVMRNLMETIKRVAESSSTVLISGESGTGKELVAVAIHSLSDRKNRPFVRLNCAAVPDTLMDSELFGHEKGAFTSAVSRRVGRFELALGGSLLLDEISEMKIGLQAKLLRVLQEQEFERVGGTKTIKANCRIIATTNRDLPRHVEEGEFRQDLYYRLNVLPIRVPSLRERVEDIPVLANSFIKKYSMSTNGRKASMRFTDEALDLMCRYSWPGNVRELENMVERLCVMRRDEIIGPEVLTLDAETAAMPPDSALVEHTKAVPSNVSSFNLADIERDTILRALNANSGNRQKTAETLGISVRTLRNKLNLYKKDGSMPQAIAV